MSNKRILIEFMDWLQTGNHINISEEDRKELCERFILHYENATKEREAEYWKRYKAEHPEQYRAYRTKWEENNPEKVKEKRKRYYENNREKIKVYQREYQKAYRERKRRENEKAHTD